MDVKSQLYSYYLYLLNEISNYSSQRIKNYQNLNYQNLDISKIIENIKDSTSELINIKVSNIICKNINSNSYFQLENYTKKIEHDIKILYHKIFEYKIFINSLEDRLQMYKMIQIEYEELKEKVKYVGGKFLDNERKDNEIIILRHENNILKKEVAKLDRFNKLNETLKKNYINKINALKKEIDKLNKKIESKYNSNNSISNYNSSNASHINININSENILSKIISKHDLENINNIISNYSSRKNKYNYLKGLQNCFPKNSFYNNQRQSNFNIIKKIYMNSNNNNKNNFNSSTVSTIHTNIFTSNFNKLLNNISHKKKKNSKSKNKNLKKNNSVTMKNEKEEDKSLSMYKYFRNFNDSRLMYKSYSKNKKSNTKIINFNQNEIYPMSCQHKNSSRIRKSLSKKMRVNKSNKEQKMKKSNSALNIKIISK